LVLFELNQSEVLVVGIVAFAAQRRESIFMGLVGLGHTLGRLQAAVSADKCRFRVGELPPNSQSR
jgi:hypothetical protein